MKDPSNIDLQSVDPDLSVDEQRENDGGATDLMDYASAVSQWGEDSVQYTNAIASEVSQVSRRPNMRPEPIFHPTHSVKMPFIVAGVLVVVILLIVFIPTE